MKIQLNTTHTRPNRQSQATELVVFERLETPMGYLFWNRGRLGWAILAALLGAFIGLAFGSYLSSLVYGPLLSSLIGLVCSSLGALLAAAFTLKESVSIPWLPQVSGRATGILKLG